MNLVCLVIAIILFVLVGFKAEPKALEDINLLGFGLAFLAGSFLPWASWTRS